MISVELPLVYPFGYTVLTIRRLARTTTDVTPKAGPAPVPPLRWTVGPISTKLDPAPMTGVVTPPPGSVPPITKPKEFTVQLTADQQVSLSISGEDRYGNPVDITGDTVWTSSDPSIVTVTQAPFNPAAASAQAVGPIGTAAITVTNDYDADGTPDFQGSIAISVVAGLIAEIGITEGSVTDKPIIEPGDDDES